MIIYAIGDGKTYYIKQRLQRSPASVTISVNEAFTPVNAIEKLRTLPVNEKDCAVFFNFTLLPPGVSYYFVYFFKKCKSKLL